MTNDPRNRRLRGKDGKPIVPVAVIEKERGPVWLLVAAACAALAFGVSVALLFQREDAEPLAPPPPEARAAPAPAVTTGAATSSPADAGALPEPPPLRTAGADDDTEEGDDTDRGSAPNDDNLTRADVVAGIGRVEDAVLACYGPEGRGTVKLTLGSSGHVIGAKVAGPLAGTRAGDCVEEAAKQATFRSTKREVTSLLWTLPTHAGR